MALISLIIVCICGLGLIGLVGGLLFRRIGRASPAPLEIRTFLEDQAYEREAASKRFLGGALMAMGGMITLLCGMCTLLFGVSFVIQCSGAFCHLGFPLVIGGIPTLIGAGVFYVGFVVYRSARSKRSQPWREFE